METRKHNHKLAVLIMPYFGRWPEWIDLYFEIVPMEPGNRLFVFYRLRTTRKRCALKRVIDNYVFRRLQ